MSIIPPGLSRLLQFYLSGPLPCPYLPNRVERKLFTRLTEEVGTNVEINATLTRAGFRRSHDIVYRPACHDCSACVPVRIPVHAFRPTASLKRIMRRNHDLTLSKAEPTATDEQYQLFMAYQLKRHPDSEMARMSFIDFQHMLTEGAVHTALFELRDGAGALLGAMITDQISDGYSAVYSFFVPDLEARSLGTQLILSLVEDAKNKYLSYVYLGYWIAGARKMSYKARFHPLQALGPQGWDWLNLTDDNR